MRENGLVRGRQYAVEGSKSRVPAICLAMFSVRGMGRTWNVLGALTMRIVCLRMEMMVV